MGKTSFQIKILKNVPFFKRAFNIYMNVKFFVWIYWRYIKFSMPKKIYFTDIIWGLKVLQSQLVLLFDLQLLR